MRLTARRCELRLALAATAEFTQFGGGNSCRSIERNYTTINAVNHIERDIAIIVSSC